MAQTSKLALAALLLAACGSPPVVDPFDASVEPPDAADASVDDAGVDAGFDAGVTVAAVYPADRTQSPINAFVVDHLQAIAARSPRRENVFAKIGDSNTVNTNYLACFAGPNVNLGGDTDLEPALEFFRSGDAGTATPFDRVSLAATVGWSAPSAIAGSPSPLEQEASAVSPRYALVMFGTNDIQSRDLVGYGRALFSIVDTLIGEGTVPVLSSIPPRDDDPIDAGPWVPRYDAVARGVAQARQIPFVDLNRELLGLPAHGMAGDGLHLNVYAPSAVARGCVFTPAGLNFGNNVRNRVTLGALSRAWNAVAQGATPDLDAPRRQGQGRADDPYLVDSLPFADTRDTSKQGAQTIAAYPGCNAAQNESGPEIFYRLVVTEPTTVRALVVALNGADIDVHVLDSTHSGAGCLVRDDKMLVTTLQPGTFYFSLDSFVSTTGGTRSGEYLFTLTPEP